jgi:stress response protein YsnF
MSKKVRIELDSESANIKKTGNLFEKIFSIAQKEVNLQEITIKLKKEEFKSGILDSLVKAIDNGFISAVYDNSKNIRKYQII